MSDYFGHDDVIVLDDRDQPIYVMSEGLRVGLGRGQSLLPDIQMLIANLRRLLAEGGVTVYEEGRADRPPLVAALRSVGGVPAIVSVAPIISDSGTIVQDSSTYYLHVSVVHLDKDYATFLQNRKTLEIELRDALKRDDQLSVAFQPLFGRDGHIVGAEALARWTHLASARCRRPTSFRSPKRQG